MKLSHNRLAVIFNPMGGSAKSGTIDKLQAACKARGIELVKLTTTADFGSAKRLSAKAVARGDIDAVIACGGDGTACQAAEGLFGSGVPLAVFPAGTGNLFARAFYASPDPERFVAMIVNGQAQPVDMVRLVSVDNVGMQQEQLFMVAAGFGKISDAISFATPRMKRIFGKLTYAVRMLSASLRPDSVRYKLTPLLPDGQTDLQVKAVELHASALFALSAVPPSMLTLSRGCNASDGLLDLVAIKANNFGSLLQFSARMATGRPDKSVNYYRMRVAAVRIETSSPVTPNIDGDPGRSTKSMELYVLPKAVQIIVS
ncbi:MAG: diacylglycerol kinase family protein [Candidatus Obscuribacterales bacterium]